MKKILKIFLVLVIMIFTGPLNQAYPDEIDNTIFNYNLSENITRGTGSIGDYSISENLIKFNKNDIPLETSDILDKLQNAENKTRGLAGQGIYGKYSRSVVLIINTKTKSIGSGSIIAKDTGTVITNWHVINEAEMVAVAFKKNGEIKESDMHIADIVAYDATKDLAIVRIRGGIPKDVNELKLSTKLPVVGSDVHAIGHPGSEVWTYTKGYVSQIRPNYQWSYETTLHKASVIQTQTPISPGNSGGPLISAEGMLLGVNAFKLSGENLNFAVSSIEVLNFLKNTKNIKKKEAKLKSNKKVSKIVSRSDSNKDGKMDTFAFDNNGDGRPDTIVEDTNHNGKPDRVLLDTNNDGRPDVISYDTNEDGKPERWIIDKDFDGNPDVESIDINGDSKPDKFRNI